MKNIRRVAAIILALVMVFSLTMASAVFAGGNGAEKSGERAANTEKAEKNSDAKDNKGMADDAVEAEGSETETGDDSEETSDKKDKSLKDQLMEQKKALQQQLAEVRKSGNLELTAQLVLEVKAFKKQMKAAVRSSYTEDELQVLEQTGEALESADADLVVVPVENIIAKGRNLKFDTPPVIKSGRMLVPVRALSQAYGAEVGYDPATRVITITKGDIVIVLQLDNKAVTVNGVETQLDVPAQSINNRTVVPIRFIVESLGLKIEHDPEDGTVEIEEEEEADEEDANEAEAGDGTADDNTQSSSDTAGTTAGEGSTSEGTNQGAPDTATTNENDQ